MPGWRLSRRQQTRPYVVGIPGIRGGHDDSRRRVAVGARVSRRTWSSVREREVSRPCPGAHGSIAARDGGDGSDARPPSGTLERTPQEASASVTCTSCGAENRPGGRFCSECGTPLAVVCPGCGAPVVRGREVLRAMRGAARARWFGFVRDGRLRPRTRCCRGTPAVRRPGVRRRVRDPRRARSGGRSPSCSRTSWASRRSPRGATRSTSASSCPSTSTSRARSSAATAERWRSSSATR